MKILYKKNEEKEMKAVMGFEPVRYGKSGSDSIVLPRSNDHVYK